PYALAVAGEIVIAVALLATAGILAESGATDHSRLHAAIALALLITAGTILRVRPNPSIVRRAPVIGLVLLAAAQLIESVGALGYGPDNDTRRNDIAVAHDIGVMATGVAVLTVVVAVAIAAGFLTGRSRRGILVPSLVVFGIITAGFLLVRVLVGF
ncbi:MAG: hypothetical protein M3Q30_27750, partial [Actinomycetota bacterium]|nr:hypothetical protein [Actinomycetota bacterium]